MKKQLSGAARRRLEGKVLVNLWLPKEQADLVREAANLEGIYLTQFITRESLIGARKKLSENSGK